MFPLLDLGFQIIHFRSCLTPSAGPKFDIVDLWSHLSTLNLCVSICFYIVLPQSCAISLYFCVYMHTISYQFMCFSLRKSSCIWNIWQNQFFGRVQYHSSIVMNLTSNGCLHQREEMLDKKTLRSLLKMPAFNSYKMPLLFVWVESMIVKNSLCTMHSLLESPFQLFLGRVQNGEWSHTFWIIR